MTNLAEVVNLGAGADARRGKLAAIDHGTGANFDVVFKDHRAEVRDAQHRHPISAGAVAKSIAADH